MIIIKIIIIITTNFSKVVVHKYLYHKQMYMYIYVEVSDGNKQQIY